jgi:hypothetical protein
MDVDERPAPVRTRIRQGRLSLSSWVPRLPQALPRQPAIARAGAAPTCAELRAAAPSLSTTASGHGRVRRAQRNASCQ